MSDPASEATTEPCPFGCDKPWPHEPNGCVFYVSATGWDELQRMLVDPPKPNQKIIDLVKEYPHAD